MRKGFLIQTLGSLTVLGAFLAAEGAAYLLDRFPASSLLWYLNLEVFDPFSAVGSEFQTKLRHWLTPDVIMILIGAAIVAHLLRNRLTVGFIANVSSVLATALVYHFVLPVHSPRTASLHGAAGEFGVDHWLLIAVCAISLAAAAFSHLSFLRAARHGR